MLRSWRLQGKLPWFSALGVLFVILAWRALSFESASLLVPGAVMLCAAAILIVLSLRSVDARESRLIWIAGACSVLLSLAFLNSEILSAESLSFLVSIWFAIILLLMRFHSGMSIKLRVLVILAMVLTAAVIWFVLHASIAQMALCVALYDLIYTTFKLSRMELKADAEALQTRVEDTSGSEISRRFASLVASCEPLVRHVDGLWLFLLTFVLFEIHLSRMGFDGGLGALPAMIALFGDLIMALVISFLIVLPLRLLWIRVFSRFEGRAISIIASRGVGSLAGRIAQALLIRHLRWKIRLAKARYSIPTLLWQGLISGLPIVFVITATVPLLGMSWFYDTEKWASIGRDKWAALNADKWRMEMVKAANPGTQVPLAIDVPGTDSGAFSFIVVGDPGQGGLAQRELAKQIVKVSKRPDVRFMLVSSDVVYPNGEMKDYEERFWSPYSGLSVPVLAIPGNHDWYDGLDAFVATFFQEDAARAAIPARHGGVDPDTLTFAGSLIDRANELQSAYGVEVQLQTSPYFQIVTDEFVLICVDTGVVAGVDEMQMQWLRNALAVAKEKTKMVVLGHPFFALNRDMTLVQTGLQPILDLLRKENVSIVMAGDTHDLEYYLEEYGNAPSMHHFVNGGGGAFLSIGSSFGVPAKRITDVWAHYPTREAITDMLDENLPPWVQPLWWWTQKFDGYPFSSDVLSTAFDFDRSPFLNSFVVVEVDGAGRQVRIVPYGVKGRLRWSDLALPAGSSYAPQEEAEWIIPMR
jgi:3',5'-cyclic AMP phosphodiesterase CpdA